MAKGLYNLVGVLPRRHLDRVLGVLGVKGDSSNLKRRLVDGRNFWKTIMLGKRLYLQNEHRRSKAIRIDNWRETIKYTDATVQHIIRYTTTPYLSGHLEAGPELVHRPEHRTDAAPECLALFGHRVDGHLPHLRVAIGRPPPRASAHRRRPSGQRVRALVVEPVAYLPLNVRLDEALGRGTRLAAVTTDETQLPAHHRWRPARTKQSHAKTSSSSPTTVDRKHLPLPTTHHRYIRVGRRGKTAVGRKIVFKTNGLAGVLVVYFIGSTAQAK